MGVQFSGNMFLISDGQKLFLFTGNGDMFVAENTFLTSLDINVHTDVHSMSFLDGSTRNIPGPQEITIDMSLIAQQMSAQDESVQDYRFAMDMTVRELLEVVQNKLKERT